MSTVEMDDASNLPAMGREAERIITLEGEDQMEQALDLSQQTIAKYAPKGGPGTTARDLTHTTDGLEGSVFPTDFRWRFFEFGTGEYNPKRKAVIGPKKGRGSRSGNRHGAIKLADGRILANVAGTKPTAFIRKAKREVIPRVEQMFEASGDDVAERLVRKR